MLNIILVDDNPGDQKLFQDTLKETGIDHRLRIASSGEKALELVNEESPDLIVLDVMMPGMSGYDVCNSLKFDPVSEKGIPILLLTGRQQEIDPRIGKLMKVFYMQKPCETQQLGDMILNICQ